MRNGVWHAAGAWEPLIFQCPVLGKFLLADIGQYKYLAILTTIKQDGFKSGMKVLGSGCNLADPIFFAPPRFDAKACEEQCAKKAALYFGIRARQELCQ